MPLSPAVLPQLLQPGNVKGTAVSLYKEGGAVPDHAMTCDHCKPDATMRHDKLTKVWYRFAAACALAVLEFRLNQPGHHLMRWCLGWLSRYSKQGPVPGFRG